ncbi:general secretion pathway protein F [Desulfuromusa kysingii]|uniref:General secretion pathway protein F n=1 Tax=Desulfuromusa kysingii TaxID=37625 RepID=A0A1H4CRD9_9BACT|nr:type II secretion system inner membrane protein GspF [Desulfuromusa kysingii]SEA62940.1 general secretion pathway protein F [Desulfuromusa kysingii]
MPFFEYSGFDTKGRKVSGKADGSGRKAVVKKLSQQGIYITNLSELAESSSSGWFKSFGFKRKISSADLAAMTRQLGTLLSAGISLDETLLTLGEQTEHAIVGNTLMAIREKILQGSSLHEAMSGHQQVFPNLYINMIQVGESSGTLDQVTLQLADFLDEQARIKSRIQAATAYPILMVLVGSGVLAFLFVFVVPKITLMLTEMDRALPWPTQLLISLSEGVKSWWMAFVVIIIAAVIALKRYRNTPAGKTKTDSILLKIPIFGRLNLLIATAWFSRTLGTLLQSGVPLLKALDISKGLLRNSVLSHAIDDARRQVQEGGSLAKSLKESGVFPPMVAQMTAAGEKSGQLEPMLTRLADTYDHQTDLSITSLLSLLEPILILVMGGVVGFVVLAILLPLFEASQGF